MSDVSKASELIAAIRGTAPYDSFERAGHYRALAVLAADALGAAEKEIERIDYHRGHWKDEFEALEAATREAVQGEPNDDREALRDEFRSYLGDEIYVCSRDYSAWSHGTMGFDDFSLASEDDEVIGSLVQIASRATVPDAATGQVTEYSHLGYDEASRKEIVAAKLGAEGERDSYKAQYDAATAALGRRLEAHDHIEDGSSYLDCAKCAIDAARAERDDLEERLAGYLWDSTGGLLSKTGYDVRTMVTHTEEYYDKVHAGARKEAEAERDAALAAVERVRSIHSSEESGPYLDGDKRVTKRTCIGHDGAFVEWPCPTIAALDGAPEPEGRWEYRGRLQSCGYVAEGYISAEHAMNGLKVELEDHPYLQMDDTAIVERARVREWLPVEGESKS